MELLVLTHHRGQAGPTTQRQLETLLTPTHTGKPMAQPKSRTRHTATQ